MFSFVEKLPTEIHFLRSDNDYLSCHVKVAERTVHGHGLFICLIPVLSSGVPIDNNDLEQERWTENKRCGEIRSTGECKDRAEHEDLFAPPVSLWPHTTRQMLMGSVGVSSVIIEHIN